MVEKCLEYLKVAGQGFEVKKISWDQQRMMLKELIYEGLKSLLPMSQMQKDWETRSCKHISQHSELQCAGLSVSVWKSGIAEGVWMSSSPAYPIFWQPFPPSSNPFWCLWGSGGWTKGALSPASRCWWLCTKWRRKLLRTKVKSGSWAESLLAKRKYFSGTGLTGSREHLSNSESASWVPKPSSACPPCLSAFPAYNSPNVSHQCLTNSKHSRSRVLGMLQPSHDYSAWFIQARWKWSRTFVEKRQRSGLRI